MFWQSQLYTETTQSHRNKNNIQINWNTKQEAREEAASQQVGGKNEGGIHNEGRTH